MAALQHMQPAAAAAQSLDTLVVVMSRSAAAEHIERAELRRIFLLRQTLWPGGRRIEPINLRAESALREAFSQAVLGSGTRELADYWNDRYFHGTQPPRVLDSERAVLLYVSRNSNAIGYVSIAALRETEESAGTRTLILIPYQKQ